MAIFPPWPRRTRPSPTRSFSPCTTRPALRISSAQFMYFWMTFCISCGLSVLGMPAPRTTTRYFFMVGLLFVRLKRRRTGAREIDRLILAFPSLPLTLPSPPLGARDQWWLGEVGPDDHAGAR